MQRCDIFVSIEKNIDTKSLLLPCNLMRYFDVISLSGVFSSIGPKILDFDTYSLKPIGIVMGTDSKLSRGTE